MVALELHKGDFSLDASVDVILNILQLLYILICLKEKQTDEF